MANEKLIELIHELLRAMNPEEDVMTERRHVTSKPVPDAKDHNGWLTYWHNELIWAIKSFNATGQRVAQEHAVRSARMLHWHAVKKRPALKP